MSLQEVARVAGVSIATVSRVINGNYFVTDETKQRVLEAIQKLNYRPNGVAKSLRGARTKTIGLIVPDIPNPYFSSIIAEVEHSAHDNGYNIILGNSNDDPQKEISLLNLMFEKRVDGIVIAPSRSKASETLSEFIREKTPIVIVDRKLEDLEVSTVVEENEVSSYELVNHLIIMGHRRIALINSSMDISTVKARGSGYLRALTDAQIEVDESIIKLGKFDTVTGYTSTKSLFSGKHEPPTAIFCANNVIAVGCLIALRELNLSVPSDVSVICFGNILFQELISPKLTTVIQNPTAIGITAARLLMDQLDVNGNFATETVILPTEIRLGNSVARLSP
ncbi:LacI family transcriptional regulator [Alicyclobacillus hesperidum subsp. aegles]|uniref:LacI family DNA-binding transcriptional regulator n=1 Tax=Alicyclobacillus hesperidum TaxID=89784 RepID=UPI00222CA772|nr:LacI family DNA-binding transcriptional regulator [Alicyclobacillus hesperidum]GLG02822.1 LacI family transcriptional regulator [Alicyclobacillus hesperidum subsp. aegles]